MERERKGIPFDGAARRSLGEQLIVAVHVHSHWDVGWAEGCEWKRVGGWVARELELGMSINECLISGIS